MNPLICKQNRANGQPPIELFNIQNERLINETYRKIMSTPMASEQRRHELSKLLSERASLLHHVPVNGLKDTVIFFNMKQIGLAPTPLCPTYNKMRVPTISSYHIIGSNIGIVLLDDNAIQHIPKEIQEKAGNLSGKQVEFIWTAIDGRPFIRKNEVGKINLVTHPWSYPHAQFKDDVKSDVNMGVFPEVGFQPYRKPGAVAFDNINPMLVHTHFGNNSMLFSPDNAHFEIIPNSPFGIFWSVTQKDNRVAFSKMLAIFDYNHPICICLLDSIRNCRDLDTHLKRLVNTQNAIQETLALTDHDFMNAFHALPPAFQYGIYKEAWVLFNSPKGIHGDFGKASFENELSLNAKFHCSNEQRKEAVANFAHRLEHLLIHSQEDLMLNSQPLRKGDNILKMMNCAQLFLEKLSEEAIKFFENFSKEEQQAVFFAIWELSECPRGNMNFGKETFFSPKTEFDLKANALLLAASRQTPRFDEILIPAELPVAALQKEEIQPEIPPLPMIEIDQPQAPTPVGTPNNLPVGSSLPIIGETPSPSETLSPQHVLEAMMNLAFSGELLELTPDERKTPIMKSFNHLPVEIKNSIYGKVYEYSTDQKKGGNGWGEKHVADDLNVLIDSLQDVLGLN